MIQFFQNISSKAAEYNFILSGQSNAVGRNTEAEATTAGVNVTIPVPNTQFFKITADAFTDHEVLMNYYDDPGIGNYGMEHRLFFDLNASNKARSYKMLKYADGGTFLVDGLWDPDTGDRTNELIAAASLSGINYNSLIWMQGEAEATDQARANNYATELTKLVARFKNEIAGMEKIYIVRLFDFSDVGVAAATVQAAYDSVAAAVSYVELVTPPVGLTEREDGIHFDASGIDNLAQHIFDNHIINDL